MDTYYLICLNLLALFIYTFYKYLTKNNDYWKSRGIPEAKSAVFGIGHMKDVLLRKKNMAKYLADIDKDHQDSSMFGIYEFQQPVLIVRHPELIKSVLQTKFHCFSDQRTVDEETEPLFFTDPFVLTGQQWKDSRPFYTNCFSSKKLKILLPAVIEVTKRLSIYLSDKIHSNEPLDIDAKKIFSRYTAGVSASVILGIDAKTFVDEDAPGSLCHMMNTLFTPSLSSTLRHTRWLTVFKIGFVPGWINKGFKKIVDEVVTMRNKDMIKRNDVLQWIIDDLKEKNETKKSEASFAFSFFVEMYETSSLVLSTIMYHLANSSIIQSKAREEVDKIVDKYGEFSYEGLSEMNYLEKIVREAQRLLPPTGRIFKSCSDSVTLEGPDGLKCNLKKGDQVNIPVLAIHRNPEHWENPDEFRPERFDKNYCEGEINKYTFLGFGEGPRKCPGQRFAVMQIKAVVATMLKNFLLEPSEKMIEPIQLNPKYFLVTLKGGYWIKIRQRTR